MLKICKIFNNNAVLAKNENNAEIVALGKGIAFAKKINDELDQKQIEKTFALQGSPFTERLMEILTEIPTDYFRLTNKIVNFANQKIGSALSHSIYISLTDHLYHAIQRIKNNQIINNNFAIEIKYIYPTEFAIGQYALQLIQQEMAINMNDDEACFIALHIFNSRTDNANMATTYAITQLIKDILHLVSYQFAKEINQSSLEYSRFVTHLKYFAIRFLQPLASKNASLNNDFLYQQTKMAYPEAYLCVNKINDYLTKHHNKPLNQDEALYLMIHIQRVIAA